MNDVESLADQLRRFLADRLSATHVRLSDLRRASHGLSRENWRVDVVWRDAAGGAHDDALILRRDPPASLLDTDRVTEFALLEALRPLSVPTPEPRWLDAEGRWFGRPSLIMTRHPGASDPFILADGDAEARLGLARRFMDLLIEIHRVDWAGLRLDRLLGRSAPPGGAAGAALDHWEARMRRAMLEPLPELEFVLAWLRAHAPQTGEEVLVHGDFKPGNLLIEAGEVVAVLDWETAHIGDPLEDLGWVVNPLGAPEHQIAGAWERADMLAWYEARTGRRVEEAALRWWSTLAIFKLAVNRLTVQRISAAGLFLHEIYGLDAMYELMGIPT